MDKESLEKRRAEEARLLTALDSLEKSEEWGILRELVFEGALERIDRLILSESLKPSLDHAEIFRLQGERRWAKRYCDIGRFADFHKSLLEDLNEKLK